MACVVLGVLIVVVWTRISNLHHVELLIGRAGSVSHSSEVLAEIRSAALDVQGSNFAQTQKDIKYLSLLTQENPSQSIKVKMLDGLIGANLLAFSKSKMEMIGILSEMEVEK